MSTTVKIPADVHVLLQKIQGELQVETGRKITQAMIIKMALLLFNKVREKIGNELLLSIDIDSPYAEYQIEQLLNRIPLIHAARRIASVICDEAWYPGLVERLGFPKGTNCKQAVIQYLISAKDLKSFTRKLQIILDGYKITDLGTNAEKIENILNDVLEELGLRIDREDDQWKVRAICCHDH